VCDRPNHAYIPEAEARAPLPQQWFGLVVESAAGQRRFRHIPTAIYSSWESVARAVAVELKATGEGSRVVKLAECDELDHVNGVQSCRFALWERA
jgi:hypothetical protein